MFIKFYLVFPAFETYLVLKHYILNTYLNYIFRKKGTDLDL